MSQDLDELVREAYALPFGRAHSALLEQVVARADAEGDDRAAFSHRLRLAFAYSQGGEPRLSFAPFARCVADLDADPQRYASFTHGLLWGYKSIVHSTTYFPEITLEQTGAMLDEMARRYVEAGHGLHAVHQHRWIVATTSGTSTPRKDTSGPGRPPARRLSDCAGCDPNEKVEHLQWVGRDAEAVALGLRVLEQPLGCVEQPQSMQTALLPPSWPRAAGPRPGTPTTAATAPCARSPPSCRATPPTSASPPRPATSTGRSRSWPGTCELASPPHPFAAMEFSAVASRALRNRPRRILRRRWRTSTERRRTPACSPTATREAARDLAARFDVRNRTTHQSERVEHLLAEDRWVEHLPLLALPGRPAPGAVPRCSAPLEGSGATTSPAEPEGPRPDRPGPSRSRTRRRTSRSTPCSTSSGDALRGA